jgi:hypothetical protein
MLVLKRPGLIEAVAIVRDGRAAARDRLVEDRAHRGDDAPAVVARQACGAAARSEPARKSMLAHVDVAEPRDLTLVHQERLDARPPAAGAREQPGGIDRRVERVDAGSHDRRQLVGRQHVEATEATRVVVDEGPPVIERHLDVIVDQGQPMGPGERQATGHAQVDEPEPAVVERRHEVLAGPTHAPEAAASEARGEVGRDRRPQARLANHDLHHRATLERGRETARDRLDLGQLRH